MIVVLNLTSIVDPCRSTHLISDDLCFQGFPRQVPRDLWLANDAALLVTWRNQELNGTSDGWDSMRQDPPPLKGHA